MDEQKKGIILNSIIHELVQKAKSKVVEESQQKRVIDLSDIIFEMEVRSKGLRKKI